MWIPEKGSPMVEMFREAAGTNTEKVAAEFPAPAAAAGQNSTLM